MIMLFSLSNLLQKYIKKITFQDLKIYILKEFWKEFFEIIILKFYLC